VAESLVDPANLKNPKHDKKQVEYHLFEMKPKKVLDDFDFQLLNQR
jgi:hypothetical protein